MEDQNNNEFEFDGQIYPTYQEMVEAKRERNRKALEKTTTEITKKLGEEYNKMRSSAKSSSASSSREGKGATTTNHGVEDDDDDYLEEDAKADGDVQVQIEKEVEEKEQKKVRTKKGTEGGSRVSISRRVKKKSTTTAVGEGGKTAAFSHKRKSVGKKKSTRTADALGSTKRAKKAPIDSTRAGERLDSLKGEDNELGATYSNAIAGWGSFYDKMMKQEDSPMSYNHILEQYAELSCNEGVKINTLNTFCLDRGITRPLDPVDGRKHNSGPERLVNDSDMDNFIMEMAEKCKGEMNVVTAVNKYGFVTRAAKEKFPQLKGGDKASCWMRKNKLQDKILKKIGEMKAEEASGKFKSLFG